MRDYLDRYWWKHTVYALVDVDVTGVRRFIAEHKARTGEGLSFTGYVVFRLARAVDEDKSVQAYAKGRKHLVIFDDVDVFLPVEREVDGRAWWFPTSSAAPTTSRSWRSIERSAPSRPNPSHQATGCRRCSGP